MKKLIVLILLFAASASAEVHKFDMRKPFPMPPAPRQDQTPEEYDEALEAWRKSNGENACASNNAEEIIRIIRDEIDNIFYQTKLCQKQPENYRVKFIIISESKVSNGQVVPDWRPEIIVGISSPDIFSVAGYEVTKVGDSYVMDFTMSYLEDHMVKITGTKKNQKILINFRENK